MVLPKEKIGDDDDFFYVGGHSLLVPKLHSKLEQSLNINLPIETLLNKTTINDLFTHIVNKNSENLPNFIEVDCANQPNNGVDSRIAIIGESCKFPNSENSSEYWENIKNGKECISFFNEQELLEYNVDKCLIDTPNYVKAKGILKDVDCFDNNFFSLSPMEADIADPQHRLLLEHTWTALEKAGYGSDDLPSVSLFLGVNNRNTYYLNNIKQNNSLKETFDDYSLRIHNTSDFLATFISYTLNLKGASVNVQTACSTSLVAVCMACQHLLDLKSDIAIGGGASIQFPIKSGYQYRQNMIYSPDGHCRPFDEQAKGIVPGDGLGVVILKRFPDAIKDGDNILGIIHGFSVNNDGSDKIGFTAPSIKGQSEAINSTFKMAQLSANEIDYLEAHGTGTELGDLAEISALTNAFKNNGSTKKQYCPIGSVKANIGHTDIASGIAGLIKAMKVLENKTIPPSFYFNKPNPKIDFKNSPFFVTQKAKKLSGKEIYYAGVSSFGVGGTNAHVILSNYVKASSKQSSGTRSELITISAKNEKMLDLLTNNLAFYLKENKTLSLADVAYTLQTCRKSFPWRRTLISDNIENTYNELFLKSSQKVFTNFPSKNKKQNCFYVYRTRLTISKYGKGTLL